ncbi:dehydrogenase [Gordonia spumicola]|uniref:Dehydrogenase n=1 Tax=Gordonia spumicola TaxID=589161 RepID=A0A7I9VA34_9ACTN|nr:FAD-dependent oxidoreductase [Gordonia spumicola]GEE02102.1 dehydrogenase [Gordonia spumicola]
MKIVIAGAGYAGTVAANLLARKGSGLTVTVVSPHAQFVERVRLHQEIAGTGQATRPLSEMLDGRVAHRKAAVEKVDDGVVELSDGTSLDFDRMIYAVGSSAAAPEGTLAVGDVDQACEAARRLRALEEGAAVTVVGAGLTGIEAASEVAEQRPDLVVRLVGDELGASLGDGARRRVAEVLSTLGVEVVRGTWTTADNSDLTLWAVAAQVSDLAALSGLDTDETGRVRVDPQLRSTSHPTVYAVGDAAAVAGTRASCQAALPQGAHAAKNIIRETAGRRPTPFSMSFVGQNVSLGRHDAVIQHAHRNDDPSRIWFGGRAGAMFKEQVCRFAARSARTGSAVTFPGPR